MLNFITYKTKSTVDDNLSTGTVLTIVNRKDIYITFTTRYIHVLTTEVHLRTIGPTNN